MNVSDTVLHRGFQLFKKYDEDGSGYLEAHEVEQLLEELNYDGDLWTCLQGMEVRHGSVGFHAFLTWLMDHQELCGGSSDSGAPSGDLLSQGFQYFLIYDSDHTGAIELDEFEALVMDLQLSVNAETTFRRLDKDGSGALEFHEFMFWLLQYFESKQTDEDRRMMQGGDVAAKLQLVFDLYQKCDEDRSGYVEQGEYEAVKREHTGDPLPPWEVMDADGSGKVEFKELFRAVVSGAAESGGGGATRGGGLVKAEPGIFLYGDLIVLVKQAKGLPKKDMFGKSDPFVVLRVADKKHQQVAQAKTTTKRNNLNPVWNESFELAVTTYVSTVHAEVYDADTGGGQDFMCKAEIDLEQLLEQHGGVLETTIELTKRGVRKSKYGTLTLSVEYKAAASGGTTGGGEASPVSPGRANRAKEAAGTPQALLRQITSLREQNRRMVATLATAGHDSTGHLIVEDHHRGMTEHKELNHQKKRALMEDIVDTATEKMSHAVHKNATLSWLEASAKGTFHGAIGGVVSAGDVAMDWTEYRKVGFGSDMNEEHFHFTTNQLNGASLGGAPKAVLDARKLWDVKNQLDPVLWRFKSLMFRLQQTQNRLAQVLSVDPSDFHLTLNAMYSLSAVLKSQPWEAGDRVLLLDCEGEHIKQQVKHIADRVGIEIVYAPVRMPMSDADILAALDGCLNTFGDHQPIMAVFSHITLPTACLLPVKKMTSLCHKRNVSVCIDGTQAVGQLDLQIGQLRADYYVGTFQTWMYSCQGTGFVVAQPHKQPLLQPLTVSYFAGGGFQKEFSYYGLMDFAPWLSLNQAVDFVENMCGGWPRVRGYCTDLAQNAVGVLCNKWRVAPFQPEGRVNSSPVFPLPNSEGCGPEDALRVMAELARRHEITTLIFPHEGPQGSQLFIRVTCQIWVELEAIHQLGDAILEISEAGYRRLPAHDCTDVAFELLGVPVPR